MFTVHLHSPVRLLVVGPAYAIAGSASLQQAGSMMRRHNVSALVVEGGNAILTERDMALAISAGSGSDAPVSAWATPAPVTVSGDRPILDAISLMLNEQVRHLVVDLGPGERGLVSMPTLTAALLQAAQPEAWLVDRRRGVACRSEIWLG